MRARSSKEEDRDRTMSNIIESLCGAAGRLAMDIGEEELMKPEGVKTLIDAMRAHVFPQARAEAKELYKMGHKPHGVMARQASQSMANYVIRRRRWSKQLKDMDKEVSLSDSILGDLMLEASGLSATEQLMIITSVNNVRDLTS